MQEENGEEKKEHDNTNAEVTQLNPSKNEDGDNQPSQEEINWKIFREKRQQEKDQLAKAQKEAEILKNAISELVEKQPVNSQTIEEDSFEKEEADRIKRLVDNAIIQKEQELFPQKLRQAFPDFDSICTAENMHYLEFHEPEFSKAIGYMPDNFEKWSAVYAAVRKKIPSGSIKKDKERIEGNLSKPQSASSPGVAQPGGQGSLSYISRDRKEENWKRMQRILRG